MKLSYFILLFFLPAASTMAAPLVEARINRVQRSVQIIDGSSSTPAREGQIVRGSQAVRTGAQSAAELLFPDQTLARVGSDTLFTFETGTRKMNLESGTLLFQIPKGVGGASIRTGAITAAITGTTGFIERGPKHYKLVLLEGTLRVFLNNRLRESMLVTGGQMLIGPLNGSSIKNWRTVPVDTAKLMKTSKLTNRKNFSPLPPAATKKIDEVIEGQKLKVQQGAFSPTNLVIDGYGTTLLAIQNATDAKVSESEQLPAPTPEPTASPTPRATPTPTPLATPTPSATPNPTPTPDATPTPGVSPTPGASPTPGVSPTPGATPTPGVTPTPVPSPTPVVTPTPIPSPTATPISGDESADYPAVNDGSAPLFPYLLPTFHAKPVQISRPSTYTVSNDDDSKINLNGFYPTISINGSDDDDDDDDGEHDDDGPGAVVSNGTTYGGTLLDGPASSFLFGSTNAFDVQTSFDDRFGANYDRSLPFGGIKVFSFKKLEITGTPNVISSGSFSDVAMVSGNGIKVDNNVSLNGFTTLTLAATDGDIGFEKNGNVTATAASFKFLHLYNRSKKVKLEGILNLPSASLYIDSASDITASKGASLTFAKGLFNALGNILLDGPVRSDYLQLDARGNIEFKDTVQAHELFGLSDGTTAVQQTITARPQSGDLTGGFVSLESAGTLKISSSVSATSTSNASAAGAGARIKLVGKRLTGTAISITNTGQVKALLDQAGTGPGGKVTLLSQGGAIAINGTVTATRGTVDIRNTGASGAINLNGATLSADVVKAGALGTNGTLNINGGTISADNLLKLYAGSSNGTVRFSNNVSLSGTGTKIISGRTVQIDNGKIVTISGPNPAQVYTNNPHFTGSGGDGTTTGIFGNKGATTKPLNQAPGF